MKNDTECVVCYKIVCGRCQWEPDDIELLAIRQGTLTHCPKCGWSPADTGS